MQEPSHHLLSRCIQGDSDAFAQLAAQQQSYVYNLAYNLLGEAEDARDLAQEALLRAWQRLPSFRGEARFTTWLYRLVVNLGLNRIARRRRRVTEVPLNDFSLADPPHSSIDPQRMYEAAERREAIWKMVDMLPAKYRAVLSLYYQHERTYEEMAQILGLPLNTVKTHLSRARQMLAARLSELKEEHNGL